MSKINAKIKNDDEFKSTLNEVARLQVALPLLKASKEAQLLAVKEKFDGKISEAGKSLKTLFKRVKTFAKSARDRLFPGAEKSASFGLGVYGFRSAAGKLVNVSGLDEDELAEKLFKVEGLDGCVSVKYSVDKDAVKKALLENSPQAEALLKYFEVESAEIFFVEANKEIKEQ